MGRSVAFLAPGYNPNRERWRDLAACRNAPGGADTFHPYGHKGAVVALSYCARCPVIIECREYGAAWNCARWGTWGGRCVTPNGVWELD
jgi:hypothetical protein